MAHPYHHAISSARQWGGNPSEYQHLHDWFDASKALTADFRHRLLRHHSFGVFELERTFGVALTLSTGRVIPTRWVGEQHVREDLGRIPTFAEWVANVRPQAWMGRATTLGLEDTPRGGRVTYVADAQRASDGTFTARVHARSAAGMPELVWSVEGFAGEAFARAAAEAEALTRSRTGRGAR